MGAKHNHRIGTGVNMRPSRRGLRHNQRGAVAIIVGLTLAVLIGFAGLALDLGRLMSASRSCRTRPMPAPWPRRAN
jgi:hypothetical protein